MQTAIAPPKQRHVGLREIVRNAVDAADWLLMSAIPAARSPVDSRMFAEIRASGTLRFKGKTGAFLSAPIRYDARSGRLEIADRLSGDAAIRHIRSGTGEVIARELDSGSDYNRHVIKIAEQLLSLGIVDEIVLGQPLPAAALLYLKPIPLPDDSMDILVREVVRAVSAYRPRPIGDRHSFDVKYRSIIRRLTKSGISKGMLTPSNMQATLQAEFIRAALRTEVWRKLWRWSGDCAAQVSQMRRLNACAGDPKLTDMVDQIEAALKHVGCIVGIYVANAAALYKKAICGSAFFAEAPVCIAYSRETSPSIDTFFVDIVSWSAIWEDAPADASIAEMRGRLSPHMRSIKRSLSLPLPLQIDI